MVLREREALDSYLVSGLVKSAVTDVGSARHVVDVLFEDVKRNDVEGLVECDEFVRGRNL